MPVSVALGCDPAVTYASTAPLPPKLDEMMLAGFLKKKTGKNGEMYYQRPLCT